MWTTGLFSHICWFIFRNASIPRSDRASVLPHMPLSHPVTFLSCACKRWLTEAGRDGQTAGDGWPAPVFWHQPFQPEGKWWMPRANFKTPWTKFPPTSRLSKQGGSGARRQQKKACCYLRGHASYEPVAVFDGEFDGWNRLEGGRSSCHNLRLSWHAGVGWGWGIGEVGWAHAEGNIRSDS